LSRQADPSPAPGYGRPEPKVSDPGPARGTSGPAGYQPKHSLDIKSMQKEAVMSYMDRVGGSVPRAGAPPDTAPPPPPAASPARRPGSSSSSHLPRAGGAGGRPVGGSRAASGAPAQPSLNFTVRREQVASPLLFLPLVLSLLLLLLLLSLPPPPQDRAAVQDTHIHHLRHQIESRLKVTPDPGSLQYPTISYNGPKYPAQPTDWERARLYFAISDPGPLHCTALHCTALHCTALH
jgi:hypothetical protein